MIFWMGFCQVDFIDKSHLVSAHLRVKVNQTTRSAALASPLLGGVSRCTSCTGRGIPTMENKKGRTWLSPNELFNCPRVCFGPCCKIRGKNVEGNRLFRRPSVWITGLFGILPSLSSLPCNQEAISTRSAAHPDARGGLQPGDAVNSSLGQVAEV